MSKHKALYIYYDHKFKCCQRVQPSDKFDGDYKKLADAIASTGPYIDHDKKYYRFMVK